MCTNRAELVDTYKLNACRRKHHQCVPQLATLSSQVARRADGNDKKNVIFSSLSVKMTKHKISYYYC